MPGYTKDKQKIETRLRRIEGQVRGIQKMVAEDRYCIDVLTQVNATRAALESVALQLLADHTEHCVAEAIRAGRGGAKVKELNEAIRTRLRETLPVHLKNVQAEVDALEKRTLASPDLKTDLADALLRLEYAQRQMDQLESPQWRPSRWQLAQAVLLQENDDWLTHLLRERRSKVHVYHLDNAGKVTKLADSTGIAGDLVDTADTRALDAAKGADVQKAHLLMKK